ncbi:MAG: AtpZ/AtpI family protein [Planctomycetota bacterium]
MAPDPIPAPRLGGASSSPGERCDFPTPPKTPLASFRALCGEGRLLTPGSEPRGGAGKDPPTSDRKLKTYLRYSGAGMQLFVAIGLFTLLGWWIDSRSGTSPIFLILGTFLGFGVGFYTLYKELFGRRR